MSYFRSILPGVVAATLLAGGCIQPSNDVHPIANAIPTADQVAIHLPEAKMTRTVGQLAPYYVVTRTVTRDLNGGTAWVLILVHAIVQYPATSTSGDTAIWGPWDGGALDPASYRLTVTALADGSYDWSLDGKSKTDPGAHFITVIAGNAVPSVPEGQGSGRFTIDFDNAELVNPVDNAGKHGVVDIAYDLAARTLDMQISTTEDRNGVQTPVDYHYTYGEAADGSGNMAFGFHGDTDDPGDAAEDGVVRSRWLQTGAGRTDIKLSGGDLGNQQITGSECWDTNFRETYYEDSVNFMPTDGDPTACPYADQDFANL